MRTVLLGLQILHVVFLALHDWVPLGRLNDVRAVRRENPRGRLLFATLLSTAPYCVCLVGSLRYLHQPYPGWLWWWLWISYGLLFVGELRAWWIPYFFGTTPERVGRYEAMFGNTAAALPARNGIRANMLHTVLHLLTFATLVTLALLRFSSRL